MCSDAPDSVPSLHMIIDTDDDSYYGAPPKRHLEDLKEILKRIVTTSMMDSS
jgi:hypothetical protein